MGGIFHGNGDALVAGCEFPERRGVGRQLECRHCDDQPFAHATNPVLQAAVFVNVDGIA